MKVIDCNSLAKELKQFIATQLKKERTDTINEIRKEVERMRTIRTFREIDGVETTFRYVCLEDIKTFLNKLDTKIYELKKL